MLNETLVYHATQVAALLILANSHVEQLVLVTGGSWNSRTDLLTAVAKKQGLEYAAIGASLAGALLKQTPKQRPLYASETIKDLVHVAQQGIALDQIEILFDPELQIDPLRLIRTLSHGRLILLSWPGTRDPSRLIYARPGHPEYRVSPIGDTLIYSLENAA